MKSHENAKNNNVSVDRVIISNFLFVSQSQVS